MHRYEVSNNNFPKTMEVLVLQKHMSNQFRSDQGGDHLERTKEFSQRQAPNQRDDMEKDRIEQV